MKILVTGTAGFIGFHLAKKLLEDGHSVLGVDIVNDYYDVRIKERRTIELLKCSGFSFNKFDLCDFDLLVDLIEEEKPDAIVHLAAQAGVRYSLTNPWAYEKANGHGTLNVFEAAKRTGVKRVVYASSSSVYGGNKKVPFSESDRVDSPVSLYAASKRANELLAHSYYHLYGMEMIGLRFFTVYGEFGRPDMALFKFARNILQGKKIDLYNNGDMGRDFTYVSDIVSGIIACVNKKDVGNEVYNLGGDNPVQLKYFVSLIEDNLGKKAEVNLMPMQPGDVKETYADVNLARDKLGYDPKVKIEEGVKRFCNWFLENKDWLLELEEGKQ